MKRKERLERMKTVEREYEIARLATSTLEGSLQSDPSFLGEQLTHADVQLFAANLEATYLLRHFAEFEQGLRDYWKNGMRKPTRPQTTDLIEGIASKRTIPSDLIENAQAVRKYRNSIIHADDSSAESIAFASARRHLHLYFRHLPPDW